MDEKESVFREKSLKRVNSPEELDRYLKVSSPSVWIFLLAVVVLLVGVLVWGYFGKVEGYVSAGCLVKSGEYECYFAQDDYSRIEAKDTLRFGEEEFVIEKLPTVSISKEDVDPYLLTLADIDGDYVFGVDGTCELEDGYYMGKIITDSLSPISFILN